MRAETKVTARTFTANIQTNKNMKPITENFYEKTIVTIQVGFVSY
jgi:hypothetical protein